MRRSFFIFNPDGSGGPISCDRRHHNEVGGVGSRPSAEEEGGRRPDGDKIREFMQQRRDKAKEEAKRAEREMEERKAVIKQRLLDLEIKRREEYVSPAGPFLVLVS